MKIKKSASSALILLLTSAMLSGCAFTPSDGSDAVSDGSEPTDSISAVCSDSSDSPESVTEAPPESTGQSDPKLSALRKEITENGFSAGMAFLGYVGENETEDKIRSYTASSAYAEDYAFLCGAPLADAGGTELYAVVTAPKECRASVYRAELKDNGEYDVHTDAAIYDGKGGDCFLLRCNVSDIHSNAAVSFKNGDEIFSVFPMLSGMDGHLAVEGCYDFSVYTDGSGAEDRNVQIARELLTEAAEVRDRMLQGMTLLYTGEHQTVEGRDCYIFALGTDREEQFVREYLYGVCDNLIYVYDAVTDTWSALGAE